MSSQKSTPISTEFEELPPETPTSRSSPIDPKETSRQIATWLYGRGGNADSRKVEDSGTVSSSLLEPILITQEQKGMQEGGVDMVMTESRKATTDLLITKIAQKLGRTTLTGLDVLTDPEVQAILQISKQKSKILSQQKYYKPGDPVPSIVTILSSIREPLPVDQIKGLIYGIIDNYPPKFLKDSRDNS